MTRNMRFTSRFAAAVAVAASAVPAIAGDRDDARNIVQTAIAAGQFKTLVKAVQAAGLVETLSSPGPFTVFAPTDEAFARLPDGALDSLLKNPDALKSVLLFHVLPDKVMAEDVTGLRSARTALGQMLAIDTSKGVRVENARVVKTDIVASNGVIHVVDAVMIPRNDVLEAARSAGSFKTLLSAIDAAGLTETLRGEGPFTIFAPTDEAFAKLPKATLENLLKDKTRLASILTYHVVPGKVAAGEVVKMTSAKTVNGESLKIRTTNGVSVNNAKIVKTDVPAANGIIHVIDSVLLPPDARLGAMGDRTERNGRLAVHQDEPVNASRTGAGSCR